MSTLKKRAKSDLDYFSELNKRRIGDDEKKSTAKKSTGGVVSKSVVTRSSKRKTNKKPDVYQPHTLSKSGEPIQDVTFHYDRSIFGDYRDPAYVKLQKKKTLEQTPAPKTTQRWYGGVGGSTITKVTTSGEKTNPVSPTSGEEITGRKELDHIVPLSKIARSITPPNEYAPQFVQNKWKEREGGKRNLSRKDLKAIHVDPKNTQMLSRAENQAKGSKVLSDYTKLGGWGTETEPQTKNPKGQAESYHSTLVEIAKNFGKRGLMSREEGQAYTEITGKEPHKLLDADNPEYSPPSNRQNITGFDAYGDKKEQRVADIHFGKEKAREAKEIQNQQAWAEYSGEKPIDSLRVKSVVQHEPIGKSKKELDLEKEHGKQNKIRSMGKHQSKPKSVVTGPFSSRPGGATEQKKKGYEFSPKKEWRRLIGTKEWEKVPKKAKVKTKTVKKDTSSKVTTVKKKSYLDEMFPGINAPKLVTNKKGILVTERIRDMIRKTKKQRFSDSESWM